MLGVPALVPVKRGCERGRERGSHGEPIERLPKDCAGQAVRELISGARPRRNFKAAHLRRESELAPDTTDDAQLCPKPLG
jgi:hypothetical protein